MDEFIASNIITKKFSLAGKLRNIHLKLTLAEKNIYAVKILVLLFINILCIKNMNSTADVKTFKRTGVKIW